MKTIKTIAELDQEIERVEREASGSDDALRSMFANLILEVPSGMFPSELDPATVAYQRAQLDLYELISGKKYGTENEATDFDSNTLLRWPFPYITRSAKTVGEYLLAYGQIIRTMALEPHHRILEIGSGYGPLTYHLASMGHQVTCVDVSKPLLDYVRERTDPLPGNVRTIHGDMTELSVDETFDAVVFFESFHHCHNHVAMLDRLPELLTPNGKVYLAGEPIVGRHDPVVPYPWGLRLDGLSLWSIRKFGWLELGFREDYLRALLDSKGWDYHHVPFPGLPLADIWVLSPVVRPAARPADTVGDETLLASWRGDDARLASQIGHRDKGRLVCSDSVGYAQFGPYVELEPGSYMVEWRGEADSQGNLGAVDVVAHKGLKILAGDSFGQGVSGGSLARLRFNVLSRTTDVEFRLRLDCPCRLAIDEVVLYAT